MAHVALAVGTVAGAPVGMSLELEKRGCSGARSYCDVTPLATGTTLRFPPGAALDPKKASYTSPAVAAAHEDRRLVDEHGVTWLGGKDGDEAAGVPNTVLNHAVGLGEQGVILAATNVAAGVDAGAALAHEDGAGSDPLAIEDLGAESLRCRIPTVTG